MKLSFSKDDELERMLKELFNEYIGVVKSALIIGMDKIIKIRGLN